jgi:hypothetical protein
MYGGSVYSKQQRNFGDARQQVVCGGPAERRGVVRATQHADDPTGAGIGTGLQVERRVANRGDAGHRVDKRLLHCLEDQVVCGPAGRHLIGVDDRVIQLAQPQCATMSAVSPRSKPLVSTTLMPAARNRTDCVLGARDRYTAAARQKPAQLALEHLKGRGRDLRCLVRRVAARREFGERG